MPRAFQRYLWTNVAIIAGSFVAFGILFYSLSLALQGQVQKIIASRTTITQRSLDLENLNKLKADAAPAAELQKKLDALLPSQDGLIGFPQFLNGMARSHALVLTFNFDGTPVLPSPPVPGYVEWSASVQGGTRRISQIGATPPSAGGT